MSDLLNRLRGKYSVGPQGVYEDRDFGNFTPAICQEAADEIEQLRAQLQEANEFIEAVSAQCASVEAQLMPLLEAQSGEAFAIGYFDSFGNLVEWKNCPVKAQSLPKNCAEYLYTSPPAAKVPDYHQAKEAVRLFESEYVGQPQSDLWGWALTKALSAQGEE